MDRGAGAGSVNDNRPGRSTCHVRPPASSTRERSARVRSFTSRRLRERPHPPLRRRRHRSERAPRRLARDRGGPPDRDHGPLGLGQVDADAHPRRARPAERGQGHDRRRRDHRHERQAADPAAPRAHRLRLPVLQPAADADGGGEHPAAALDRRREARARMARGAARHGRDRRPPHAPPLGALRRPAAARLDRPRADLEADGAVRRRADRQPRLDTPARTSSRFCATRSTSSARRP